MLRGGGLEVVVRDDACVLWRPAEAREDCGDDLVLETVPCVHRVDSDGHVINLQDHDLLDAGNGKDCRHELLGRLVGLGVELVSACDAHGLPPVGQLAGDEEITEPPIIPLRDANPVGVELVNVQLGAGGHAGLIRHDQPSFSSTLVRRTFRRGRCALNFKRAR